jgi:hypothetical protein
MWACQVGLVWNCIKTNFFVQFYNISHMLENLKDFESTKIEKKLEFSPYDMVFVGSYIFDIKFKHCKWWEILIKSDH